MEDMGGRVGGAGRRVGVGVLGSQVGQNHEDLDNGKWYAARH